MRPSDSPEQAAAATPLHDRAELAQSALENLFEVSPDAIFVTDGQGLIRGANPRAAELFGHTQAELVGQPIENLVPARFRSRHPSHRENCNAMAFRRIAELRDKLRQEKQYLESEINLENRYEDIVGESKGLRQVLMEIETVAPTDATVLIQGESGTGKELLARAIHRLSPRSERTYIRLNCAAIPADLLESELFGHEKGAFTGAIARKIGRVELAHEGTLFLDEIGELPLDLQPKLLRPCRSARSNGWGE